MPYFILIFASVKIKDKSEYSRDLTNRKKKKEHRVDQYCLEVVTFELLRSTFDSTSPLCLMPTCFLEVAFLGRDGGDNRESD